MGRLLKILLQILLITLFISETMHCERWEGHTDWRIEWIFIDTTSSLDQITYLIEIWADDDTIEPDSDLDGFLEATSDSTGLLCRTHGSEDKSLFLERNPTVQAKLFNIDNDIVYDSFFTWQEMDFKHQISDVDGRSWHNLSKKTIYIDIPECQTTLLSRKLQKNR